MTILGKFNMTSLLSLRALAMMIKRYSQTCSEILCGLKSNCCLILHLCHYSSYPMTF